MTELRVQNAWMRSACRELRIQDNAPARSNGGSWAFTRDYCRAAFRFRLKPAESYDNLGFRVVLAPAPPIP